MIWLSN